MSQEPYAYKAIMTSSVCSAKRAIAFHDTRFLNWWQIGKEAYKHLTSQTCYRCSKNHKDETYVATDIERGEPDRNGVYCWRDVYPETTKDYNQLELSL